MITKDKSTNKKSGKKSTKEKTKKVSKTWLAFQEAIKNPGVEILDMKAVLK